MSKRICLLVEATTLSEVEAHFTADQPLTVLLPPNIAGPITAKDRQRLPLWRFGMLGWEGTRMEAAVWTDDQIRIKIIHALQLGYDPIMRPPGGRYDGNLTDALERLEADGVSVVLLHNVDDAPTGAGLFYPGSPQQQESNKHTLVVTTPSGGWKAPAEAEYLYPDDHAVLAEGTDVN